jgi:hypothetical protein
MPFENFCTGKVHNGKHSHPFPVFVVDAVFVDDAVA